jgi:Rieske Fe-S protein
MVLVRNPKLEFDILLIRINENSYNALLMKCTHQDNALTANKSGLYCSAHGSTFDLEGNVTKEPALTPLKKFKTEVSNSSVTINLGS